LVGRTEHEAKLLWADAGTMSPIWGTGLGEGRSPIRLDFVPVGRVYYVLSKACTVLSTVLTKYSRPFLSSVREITQLRPASTRTASRCPSVGVINHLWLRVPKGIIKMPVCCVGAITASCRYFLAKYRVHRAGCGPRFRRILVLTSCLLSTSSLSPAFQQPGWGKPTHIQWLHEIRTCTA
jgi:hypothetical protein